MSEIYSAMAAVMADTSAIGKDQRNQQQGFQYRGIDDVYNAMHGILAKHGIFTAPEVLEKTREERTNNKGTVLAFVTLRMKYTFWAKDGSSVSCIVEGEGMDSGDKATNKAMAIAHKYALLQTFCIPTAEQKDPDAEVHEVAPRKPVNRPTEKPHVPEFIPLENVLAEMDGAFSLAELGQIFTERQTMAKHHYSQGEFKQFVAKKDEMKAKLQGAA